jgi:hypothetical protein
MFFFFFFFFFFFCFFFCFYSSLILFLWLWNDFVVWVMEWFCDGGCSGVVWFRGYDGFVVLVIFDSVGDYGFGCDFC